MQLKKSSERKEKGEDPHEENTQCESESVLKEDEYNEFFEGAGDIESYIDEVSEHMERDTVVRDPTSTRVPTIQGAKVLDNSPLSEVSECLIG